MHAAPSAELFQFQAIWCRFFIFCRYVIPLFTLSALQNYVFSRHKSPIFKPLLILRLILFPARISRNTPQLKKPKLLLMLSNLKKIVF
jgi:hypothetical protein